MTETLTPMLNVPDVAATAAWYASLGFEVTGRHEDGGETLWARVRLDRAELMFNGGGSASDAWRREVDLYVQTDRLDALYSRLKDDVEVIEPPHDTEYGMREFIIRDFNRFWITFGQPAG